MYRPILLLCKPATAVFVCGQLASALPERRVCGWDGSGTPLLAAVPFRPDLGEFGPKQKYLR